MSELKRYTSCGIGGMVPSVTGHGEWANYYEALSEIGSRDAEIAARDARIAELEVKARMEIGSREMRIAELERAVKRLSARPTVADHKANGARITALEAALRELVEDIEDSSLKLHWLGGDPVTVGAVEVLHRTNCPECEKQPDEVILRCPLHMAKALLAKGGAE